MVDNYILEAQYVSIFSQLIQKSTKKYHLYNLRSVTLKKKPLVTKLALVLTIGLG